MAKLDILLASYGPHSQPYLNACLKSLERQTFKDFKGYLVSSGDFKPQIDTSLSNFKHLHYSKRHHFPEAIQEAYNYSKRQDASDLIMLLNDDTILGKETLEKMVQHFRLNMNNFSHLNERLILNSLSNCDNAKFYLLKLGFKKRDFEFIFESNQYKMSDIEPHIDDIIENPFTYSFGRIFVQMVCFYGTMMTRKLYESVGGICPEYKTGKDDLDFCLRAKNIGARTEIALDSFIFHFSGISNDIYVTEEDKLFNQNLFNERFKAQGLRVEK